MSHWVPRLLLTGAVLALLAPAPSLATVGDDICTVRTDANGDCHVDVTGNVVIVEGIVVAWKHFGNRGPGAIYDPQTGCCISVFDIDTAPDIPIGHRVRVEGWVGQFAGLDEITDDPLNGASDPIITDLGLEAVPSCVEVAGANLLDNSPTAEGMESCLIAVCGSFVDAGGTFVGNTNYEFLAEDGNTVEIRVDIDTNIPGTGIPVGPVTVCGVLSQFDGFSNSCVGYQLLPRSLADLGDATCEPVQTEESSWGRVKGIYR